MLGQGEAQKGGGKRKEIHHAEIPLADTWVLASEAEGGGRPFWEPGILNSYVSAYFGTFCVSEICRFALYVPMAKNSCAIDASAAATVSYAGFFWLVGL